MNVNSSRALLRMLKHRSMKVNELPSGGMNEDYLGYLQSQGILHLSQGVLYVTDPVRLAMEAIKLGADVEAASRWLNWRDFERLCVEALGSHNFSVKAPFRFKADGKRYEIDVVAHKKNFVLCIDCKHWKMKHGQKSRIKDSTMNHLNKCVKFAELVRSSRVVKLEHHNRAYLVPMIVTLMELDFNRPLNGVWILPIFKLNSFLLDLEAHLDELSLIKVH
ncbi:MAG: NERD domain-containing protein [Candidatus Nezhaarchaeales archaeon]